MARIPVKEVPGGGQLGIQSVRQPLAPTALGGKAKVAGMATQTVSKLSEAMGKIVLQQEEENNASWVREATENLLTVTDAELSNTIINKTGKNAIGTAKNGALNFQDRIDMIEGEAPNNRALEAFRARSFGYKRAALNQYTNHEGSETKKWRTSTAKGVLDKSIKSLGSKWRMPDAWTGLYIENNITPAVKDLAKLTGVDEGTLQREVVSQIYVNKISQTLADGRGVEAEKLFVLHKEKIDSKSRTPLIAEMRRREVDGKSEIIARKISDDLAVGEINENKALGIIKQIEDKDVRDSVSQKFSAMGKDRAAFQKNQTTLLVDKYYDIFTDGIMDDPMQPGLKKQMSLGELYSWSKTLPEETKPQKKAKQWALKRYAWASEQKGINPRSNPDSYSSIMTKIIQGDITDSTQLKTDKDAAELTRDDIKVLDKTLENKQSLSLARSTFRYTQGEKKWTKQREYDFMSHALKEIQRTNRGDDKIYIQGLVDKYLGPGGIVEGETFLGDFDVTKKQTLEDAILQYRKDPKSIDIKKFTSDTPEPVKKEIDTMFYQYPKMAEKWIRLANGDRDLAIRLKYNNDLKTSLGKRTE